MYLDIEESESPPVEFPELEAKYSRRGDTIWRAAQTGETYCLDREQRLVALPCKPASLSSDIALSREVVGQVKHLMSTIDA